MTERDTIVMQGFDGFLGSRASIGMDVVIVGLVLLLPILFVSIMAVKQGRYRLHKSLQIFIMVALLAAILIFEIDIRLFSDWRLRATPSPYWPVGVGTALAVHLVFAVSTLVLLLWVLIFSSLAILGIFKGEWPGFVAAVFVLAVKFRVPQVICGCYRRVCGRA